MNPTTMWTGRSTPFRNFRFPTSHRFSTTLSIVMALVPLDNLKIQAMLKVKFKVTRHSFSSIVPIYAPSVPLLACSGCVQQQTYVHLLSIRSSRLSADVSIVRRANARGSGLPTLPPSSSTKATLVRLSHSMSYLSVLFQVAVEHMKDNGITTHLPSFLSNMAISTE